MQTELAHVRFGVITMSQLTIIFIQHRDEVALRIHKQDFDR